MVMVREITLFLFYLLFQSCVASYSSVELLNEDDYVVDEEMMIPQVSSDSTRWQLMGMQNIQGGRYEGGRFLPSQGMAISHSKMLMYNFFHDGFCMVHLLDDPTFTLVSDFKMDVYGSGHHFGITSVDHSNNTGVYLYTQSIHSKNQCLVFRLDESSSKLVQIITFPHKSAEGFSFQYCVGDGYLWERAIMGDANHLSGNGICILRRFRIPSTDRFEVEVGPCLAEYIVPNVYSIDMSTIQGFKVYHGTMLALFGKTDSYRCLQIIDIKKRKVTQTIPLNFIKAEPEDCDITDLAIYVVMYPSSGVYVQKFN